MSWFYNYGGHEIKTFNPYPFLETLYKKLVLSFDSEPQTDDEKQMFDTFDSIYVEMLTQSGIIKQDDYAIKHSIHEFNDIIRNRFCPLLK